MSERKIGTVASELIAAKRLLSDPNNWASCGQELSYSHKRCAVTAISEVTGDASYANFHQALLLDSARTLFGRYMTPIRVNDKLGHAAVMKLYDHAISKAISEGK